ncbi:MAG: MFS transporter [Comamonadaceae bacterium SCN 68-20]|nr:MAG: MFS transporter [Comamonadaceae bacterium SCN 68-20]OJX06522.1 MAG: MFS transporter [Burkholderiales bacterium 68-20]
MTEKVRLAALQALFAWLHLALTAPSVYLWLGLPLLMRQQGWSGVQIGLFQLAGLPAVAKFLLARPVERGPRRYRAWGVGLCLALAAVLVLLGWADLLASPAQLFALAFAAALLATWADIPVNALAIRHLPAGEQLRAGALRSAALSLGAIAGGGLMLLVQLRWGWRAPFWTLAGMLVLGAALLCLLPPEPDGGRAARVPASLRQDWRGYIAQPGARGWTLLLVLYFPFVGTAWFYLKPLLLDLGFDAPRVAQVAGVGGGMVAAAASGVAAYLARRIGLRRAVPVGAWLGFAALAGLALVAALRPPAAAVFAAAAGVAVAMGYIAALAFALTMHFARQQAAAADYGVQSSLFAFSRVLVPAVGGWLLDRAGYAGLLAGLAAAMLGVCLLCMQRAATLPGQGFQKE